MRTVLLIGLMFFLVAVTTAQTVLPNWLIDSMAFEVQRGRQCSLVIEAQQREIESLGKELIHTNTALKLSESKSQTLEVLLHNSKEGNEILGKQFALDKKKLERKVRKRNLLLIGETVLIVLLLL